MKKTISSRGAGFTLVEAMVAISILSLSITGPLVIAQKGIASAGYSRDQVTAFYLAQEAVEYVRNVRDTNINDGADWLDGLGECRSDAAAFCTIDVRKHFSDSDAILGYLGGDAPFLNVDKNAGDSLGFYGYETAPGWVPTFFRREVSVIDPLGAYDKEVVLEVRMTWSTNLFSSQKEFTVKEVLFNVSSI